MNILKVMLSNLFKKKTDKEIIEESNKKIGEITKELSVKLTGKYYNLWEHALAGDTLSPISKEAGRYAGRIHPTPKVGDELRHRGYDDKDNKLKIARYLVIKIEVKEDGLQMMQLVHCGYFVGEENPNDKAVYDKERKDSLKSGSRYDVFGSQNGIRHIRKSIRDKLDKFKI